MSWPAVGLHTGAPSTDFAAHPDLWDRGGEKAYWSGASLPPELLQSIVEREANAEPIKTNHVAIAVAKDAL
jgi:hypothetical protein